MSPSLSELCELALQEAYERRGMALQMHPDALSHGHLVTPVVMNGELCRVKRLRPAIE